MKIPFARLLIAGSILLSIASVSGIAQSKVGYVASQVIRDRYPEAQQANQRIEALANEWKHELDEQLRSVELLEMEIKKNRLIWSDAERRDKEETINRKKSEREDYARSKFGVNGSYDSTVASIMKPVESKIFAAIQEIASSENFDIIWDKSQQPLVYTTPKNDITVKVMERLGIPVEDLKAKQEEELRKQKEKEAQNNPKQKARPGAEKPSDKPIIPPMGNQPVDPKTIPIVPK